MKLESIKIRNYKALRDVELKNLGPLSVFLGRNGVGKTTLFDVFGFMKDCLSGNVSSALQRRGGYEEVVSRESSGHICFEFKYRVNREAPLTTYTLEVGAGVNNRPVVLREVLKQRRGQKGQPWHFLDYKNGIGDAVINDASTIKKYSDLDRKSTPLKSPDTLALSALGLLQEFPMVTEFRSFIDDWFVSDFKIDAARNLTDVDYAEKLDRDGSNIANVARFLKENHPKEFDMILKKMEQRIPDVGKVDAVTTDDGQILLKFTDGRFKNPFTARFVSDGTIKMFTYLVMLADPSPHQLLCVEEPENQLYPQLLSVLAEEFREYANRGGQIFVSTHSPEFVDALNIDELYVISKDEKGYSKIDAVSNNAVVSQLCSNKEFTLGYLWNDGTIK